ncbi:MAG: sulfatase/phosphatase domain-containing protein [Kiritimatiellales bacterium]
MTTALCAPSRASLLIGKYGHQSGFTRNGNKLAVSQLTFPKVLQSAGYQTAIIGKWHQGTQPQGFDYYSVLNGQGRYWAAPFLETGHPWPGGKNVKNKNEGGRGGSSDKSVIVHKGYLTDVITDLSIEWLEKRDRSKPFCLLVHHKASHVPHTYPEKYKSLFTENLPYPDTFDDDWAGREPLSKEGEAFSKFISIRGDLNGDELGEKKRMDKSDPEAYKKWAYQIFMKGYYRLVTCLDENVGRLLDHLDKAGLSENTLVVYTSDNGFFIGDHGLYNKMWMYEEALRLPLLVRLPGRIQSGSVCKSLVSMIDFAATFADYAGAPMPAEFQGQSIRPLLEGKPQEPGREVRYYHYYGQYGVPAHCGIRTQTHKLICFYEEKGGPVWELYDLTKDPDEIHNLAGNPEQGSVLNSMKKKLFETMKSYGDPLAKQMGASD